MYQDLDAAEALSAAGYRLKKVRCLYLLMLVMCAYKWTAR